jgi:hypothetical protein
VVLRMASALEPTGPKRPYEQALANDMAARRG